MKINNFFKVFISIIISESAGIIGSAFTIPEVTNWYAGLAKPTLNPPAWMFGPVWTILYALMGISLFFIWSSYSNISEEGEKGKIHIALFLFVFQLILNIFWSILFFGMHSPGWAFVDIIALWLAIIWTIMVFYKISKPAAWLLIPYILWVSFACYLNFAVWMLN